MLRPDIGKKIIDRILDNWRFAKKENQKESLASALKIATELPDWDTEKDYYISSVQKQIDFVESMRPS